jgi:hypothetical protein
VKNAENIFQGIHFSEIVAEVMWPGYENLNKEYKMMRQLLKF